MVDYGTITGGTIQIVNPDPPTGDGGQALNSNFKAICDTFNALDDTYLEVANNLDDVSDAGVACGNIGALQVSQNLSDVADAPTACINLGALQVANSLSDITDQSAARSNIGLGGGYTGSITIGSVTLTFSNGICTGV